MNEKGVLVAFGGCDEAESIPTIEWASVPRDNEIVRFQGRIFRVVSVVWEISQQQWMREPRVEANITVELVSEEKDK